MLTQFTWKNGARILSWQGITGPFFHIYPITVP
jgi:hypothetical protein